MSYCGALPIGARSKPERLVVESDSRLLIDTALSHIRKDARLDEHPVLLPIQTVVMGGAPTSPPAELERARRGAARNSIWSIRPTGSVQAVQAAAVAVSIRRSAVPTERSSTGARSTLVRRLTWPVFLCGFVAGIFGGLALMKSPVGSTPAVRLAIRVVKRQLTVAYTATTVAKTHHSKH